MGSLPAPSARRRMRIIRYHPDLRLPTPGPILTIGNFDGVHLGHREIFRQMLMWAGLIHAPAIAVTFEPHPGLVMAKRSTPFLLNTLDEKIALLEQSGLDGLLIIPFGLDFARLSARRFLDDYIVGPLDPDSILIGEDFRFGAGREAGAQELADWLRDRVRVQIIPKLARRGAVVSSTAIRAALRVGNMETARELLGRWPFISGLVEKGNQVGRELGFPTANLNPGQRMLPADGVYASWVCWNGGWVRGATYVGTRPTFDGDALVVETFLITSEPLDLYGQPLVIQFVQRIRPDRKFSNIQELEAQIAVDLTHIEAALNVYPPDELPSWTPGEFHP